MLIPACWHDPGHIPPNPGTDPSQASSVSPAVHGAGRARSCCSPLTFLLALALVPLKLPLDPPGFISVSKAESEQSLEQCPVANRPSAVGKVTPSISRSRRVVLTFVHLFFYFLFFNLMELAVLNQKQPLGEKEKV